MNASLSARSGVSSGSEPGVPPPAFAIARSEASEPSFSNLLAAIRKGRPPSRLIAVALVASLFEVGSALAFPVVTRNLLDQIDTLDVSVGGLVRNSNVQLLTSVLILGAIAGGFSTYLLARAGLITVANLRQLLVQSLLAKSICYFDRHQSGEHASRITNDANAIANLVTRDLQHLIGGVLLMLGSAVVLSILDMELTLTVFGIVMAAFLLMAPILARMSNLTANMNDRSAALTGMLARTFSEIRLVKAFNAERLEADRSRTQVQALLDYGTKAAQVEASLQPMMSLALTLSIVAIFVYGGARVAVGTLSAGTLTAFILYIFNIVAPMAQLSMFFSNLQSAKGASLRIGEILSGIGDERGPVAPVHPDGVASIKPAQLLIFDGVELTYEAGRQPALSIDHLAVPARQSMAIIGPSGGGKSTLFSLIERFYTPTKGRIAWGDCDIGALPMAAWRAAIGYVPQSTILMDGSVRENLTYGMRREIGLEELEAVAEAAHCLDFIRAMPDGFETYVGNGGGALSGGQRQRIAIARMFLRDPHILLLDEATSSLDGESESIVLRAMSGLMAGRTTLVITHRWSTIEQVDQIAVIEAGQLTEVGSAAEVMRNSSYCNRVRASARFIQS